MLAPAHVGHLALLRSLIRQGAADGSFDRELATDSPGADAFFAQLKRALVSGYFVEERADGSLATLPVPGYVFWPEGRQGQARPVGFGLFRSMPEGGHELWLAGIDISDRGHGNGRALLAALFATVPGRSTHVVRVQRSSRHMLVLQRLLADFGFAPAGDSARLRWFVHENTPPPMVSRLRDVLEAQRAFD